VKIAHLSDLHYCRENLEETSRCVDYAVQEAASIGCDVMIVSGDLFERRLSANDEAYLEALLAIRRASEHFPVFILQGTYSHDAPGQLRPFRYISTRHPVYVFDEESGVVVLRADGQWELAGTTEHDISNVRLVVCALPPFNKAKAAAIDVRSTESVIYAELSEIIEQFANWADAAKVAKVPVVMVSHGTVTGSITEHGIPMAGTDHEFTQDMLARAHCDVLLGHIHQHQVFDLGSHKAAYAGSIGRFHHGEKGQKGWLLWEIGPVSSVMQRPTPHTLSLGIELHTVDEVERLAQIMDKEYHDYLMPDMMGRTVVRLRFHVDEEHRGAVDLDAIRETLSGFMDVKIEPIIHPVIRTRTPGINKSVDSLERLTHWAKAVNEDAPVAQLQMLEKYETVEEILSKV